MHRLKISSASLIALSYLLFAVFWIGISDSLVDLLIEDRSSLVKIQAWKGVAFVTGTALLIYWLAKAKFRAVDKADALDPSQTDALGVPALLFSIIAALIFGAGYLAYRAQAEKFIGRQFTQQSAAATLKAHQIGDWLSERQQAIERIRSNRNLFSTSETPPNRPPETYFSALIDAGEWLGITLIAADGRPLFSVGEAIELNDRFETLIRIARASNRPILGDIRKIEHLPGHYRLDFAAPIDLNDATQPHAMLILSVDPEKELFSTFNEWPIDSNTAEILLIGRQNDQAVYVNRPKFADSDPLELRKPLTSPNLAAAVAIQGQSGVCECIDYRNEPVLSAYAPVPQSDWSVLAKIDAQEVLQPLRVRTQLILFAILLALGVGGFALLWLWREQRFRLAALRQQQSEARAAIVSHYDRLIKLARDLFLLTDTDGRIVEVNEAAAAAYGYSQEQLQSMRIDELYPPHLRPTLSNDWQSAAKPDGAVFETLQQRSDGSVFPVEISCNTLTIGDRSYRQSFIRDISARYAAEAQIRRLNRTYAVLSETNQAIVRIRNPDQLFERICRIAIEFGGYIGAWIGRVDHTTGCIVSVASDGALDDYIAQIELNIASNSPKGRGPTASALRDNQPYYCDDFKHDPATEHWHDLAERFGIGASAALPLHCGGRVEYVLNLYAGESDVFDPPMRTLLEEMAQDVSFALEIFEREAARKETETRLDILFKTLPDFVWLKDPQGVYLACNPAFERIFDAPSAEIVGKTDYDFVSTQEADAFRAADLRAATSGESITLEETFNLAADGDYIWAQTTKTPMFDSEGRLIGVLGIARDITELKNQQALLTAGNRILEYIASGKPVDQTLESIVQMLESQNPDMLCSILLLDEDGRHLRHAAAPSLPEAYKRFADGIEIGPSVGSCGTAVFRKQPVFVNDIEHDPLWVDCKSVALEHGLRACWSTPIFSSSETVLGTFAIYYRTVRDATDADRKLIDDAVHLAAIAIEKADNQQRLIAQLEELRRWRSVTLNREMRVLELKGEVNELLIEQGEPPRYEHTKTESKS